MNKENNMCGGEVEEGEIVEELRQLRVEADEMDDENSFGMDETGIYSSESGNFGIGKEESAHPDGFKGYGEGCKMNSSSWTPISDDVTVLTAAIESLHERLLQVEKTLDIRDGLLPCSGRKSKQISRDAMLTIIVETIESYARFGCPKLLLKKHLSERLEISFHDSQYYNKKLSMVLKYGLAQNLFSFCKKEQLFKKRENV